MNKKHLKLALFPLGFAAICTACGGSDQPQQPAEADTVEVAPEDQPAEEVDAPFSYKKDSIERKYKTITCKLSADFAKDGNKDLVDNINSYINKTLGGQYKDNISDTKEVLSFYTNHRLDELKPDWEEGSEWAQEVNIVCSHETENYVSYTSNEYGYTGGAHGYAASGGTTFRKSDGKQLVWNMFDTNNNAFKQLVKEGIKSYFEENLEEKIKSDEDFKGMLLDVEDVNNIPLPAAGPYFDKKGLVFHYGQYEIASYACGMPEFVMPFSTVKKFLKEPGF